MVFKRFSVCFVVFLIILIATIPGVAFSAEWKSLYPSPTPNEIFDSYTPDGEIIYMVGSGGTILRYDGSALNLMESPTKLPLYAIDGTGPSNIWAVGGDNATDSTAERAVILHYDGNKWTQVPAPAFSTSYGPTTYPFSDVYAVSPTNAWAVMKGQQNIARWNGKTWESLKPLDRGPQAINGYNKVCGASANAIWLVGDTNLAAFWNGSGFSDISRNTEDGYQNYTSCWAADNNTLFTGGNTGGIAKLDRTGNYQSFSHGQGMKTVSGATGTSASDVYFLGFAGFFVHYDGTNATQVIPTDTIRRNTMASHSSGDWIVGTEQGIQIYRNGEMKNPGVPAALNRSYIEKVIWENGLWIISSYLSPTSPVELLSRGRRISIYSPEEKTYSVTSASPLGNGDILFNLFDFSNLFNYAFIFSGGIWNEWIPFGYGTNRIRVNDALRSQGGKLFALVGYGNSASACLFEDDSSNCHLSSAVYNALAACGETVYAVGNNGAVAVYRNGNWSSEQSGTENNLTAAACSGNEVYAVGEKRTAIWKTDSASVSWQPVSNLTEKEYYDFSGLAYGSNTGFTASLTAPQTGGSQWISFLYSFDSGSASMDEGWMGPNIRLNAVVSNGETGFAAGHPGIIMYTGAVPGFIPDLTKDKLFYLDDSIIIMQIIAGENPDADLEKYYEIFGNEQIGLPESIHILKEISE